MDEAQLRKHIADLHEAIEPFLPFALADNFKFGTECWGNDDNEAKARSDKIQRETTYFDLGCLRRLRDLYRVEVL